jgi:putative NADH-flavin reductase
MSMMKIVIFGAAGATGRILVERALAQGHEVTAFDRQTTALTIHHPKLTLVQGDIFNSAQVEEAIAGQDVVISVLGVRPGVTIPVCSKSTDHIIAAMQKRGVKRLICQLGFVVAALDGEWREVPY